MYKDLELEGKKIYPLISSGKMDLSKSSIKLVCLYDNNKDTEYKITQVNDNSFLTEEGRLPFDWLTIGDRVLVVKNDQNAKMIEDAIKTPVERKKDKLLEKALSLGLPPDKCSQMPFDNLENYLKIFNTIVPSQFDREQAFEVSRKYSLNHFSVLAFEKCLNDIEKKLGSPDPQARFHLTYMFRHTGKLRECIKCSNVVEYPRSRFPCKPGLLSVIATVRAACFLDIFEIHFDAELLKVAKKTIDKSYAISKSSGASLEEVSLVYKRLDKCRDEINRVNVVRRVNEAYKNWSDWLQ